MILFEVYPLIQVLSIQLLLIAFLCSNVYQFMIASNITRGYIFNSILLVQHVFFYAYTQQSKISFVESLSHSKYWAIQSAFALSFTILCLATLKLFLPIEIGGLTLR
jgi:hypothetical protein